jgi:TatD DNase family protein
MLVDSHCHLNMVDYVSLASDIDTIIQAAKENGVQHMLCVGTQLEDIPANLSLAEKYTQISISIGLHPNEPTEHEPSVEQLISLATHPKVVAIGETGLDYYRSQGNIKWQQDRFRVHICAAKELGKPLIIHTRQAREDTINTLKEEQASEVGGVLHCFTEDWNMAKQALELGFYISFSGIVTFKNAVELQEVARKLPLDRMLIETDSPYLAPIPYRGKINQPAYVKQVAEFLATLRGISFEALAEKTTENFYQLFLKS